ncbi:MAG TPA: potassium-transporting ATPase subunit KdpA, partial [Methylovirgula sp.]
MTVNGWIQIALYSVVIIALTKPVGFYLTRVFSGERTFLSPILRPVERAIYAVCGVNEAEEQHSVTYAISMAFFSA